MKAIKLLVHLMLLNDIPVHWPFGSSDIFSNSWISYSKLNSWPKFFSFSKYFAMKRFNTRKFFLMCKGFITSKLVTIQTSTHHTVYSEYSNMLGSYTQYGIFSTHSNIFQFSKWVILHHSRKSSA